MSALDAWKQPASFVALVALQLWLAPMIRADEIEVLSYNVYMRPFFHDGQAIRADYLADALIGHDVIVLQELYDDRIRSRLLADLSAEYPFHTRILGADAGFGQDGGVIVLSKWPIVRERQRVFTDDTPAARRCPGPDCCAGLDCYADKGVVYARINKTGRRYHVFGTHLQAGREHAGLRTAQLKLIREFIEAQRIPGDQPVIIAGDMNVDRYDPTGFAQLCNLLNARQPPLRPTVPATEGAIYTFDGPRNDLNDHEDVQRYVDYVLYSTRHLKPLRAFNQVRIMLAPAPWRQHFWQAWRRDLSDHYAVLGRFDYASDQGQSCTTARRSRVRESHPGTKAASEY
jgi:endonuclease/exonuclease/phosphatase family metal-dependent hydrolase